MPRRKRKRESGSGGISPPSKLSPLSQRRSSRYHGVCYIASLDMFKAEYEGRFLGYFLSELRAGIAVDALCLKERYQLNHPLASCLDLLDSLVVEIDGDGAVGSLAISPGSINVAGDILNVQPPTFPDKGGEVDGVWEKEKKASREEIEAKQWKEAEKVVRRMKRTDRYEIFGEGCNLRLCLSDIEMALDSPKTSPYSQPKSTVLDWTKVLKDVERMCIEAISKLCPEDVMHAKKFLQASSQMIEAARERLRVQLRQCDVEEKLDKLQEQNQEPAVQGRWSTEPFDITPYERIPGYISSRDLPKDEQALVMAKIITTKPSEKAPIGLKLEPAGSRHFERQANVKVDLASTNGDLAHSANGHAKNKKRRMNDGDRKSAAKAGEVTKLNGTGRRKSRNASINGHAAIVLKEKNVWGIDCFTKRNIQLAAGVSDETLASFLRCQLLPALNAQTDEVAHNMIFALEAIAKDKRHEATCAAIMKSIELFGHHNFRVWPKGRAVIAQQHISKDTYVTDYLGALMPAWRWFEQCVAVELVQKHLKLNGELPAFYNIMLERSKDCPEGYDLVFVDASDIGNFASRLSHSCSPNCASRVAVVNGKFAIQMRTIKDVIPGEELTHDYHASTDNMAEFQAAICLCGTQECRGSYLYHTQNDDYLKIIRRDHGLLERLAMIVESCESELRPCDVSLLDKHGLRSSVLDGLPEWGKKFAALILTVIERESERLTRDGKRKKNPTAKGVGEAISAEEVDGIAATRVQSLVIALDKIKYICRATGDSSPPIHRLSETEVLEYLWNGANSVAKQLWEKLEGLSSKPKKKAESKKSKSANKAAKSQQRTTSKVKLSKKDSEMLNKLGKLCNSDVEHVVEARQRLRQMATLLLLISAGQKKAHVRAAEVLISYSTTQAFYRVYHYPEFTSPPLEINQTHIGGITEALLDKFDAPKPTELGGMMKISVKSRSGSVLKSPRKPVQVSRSPRRLLNPRSPSKSPRKKKKPVQHPRRSVVARKAYHSEELLQAMLNWIEPLSTSKVNFRDELYGAAWFPCVEGAYSSKAKLSAAEHHSRLVSHLQDSPFTGFPHELKASFGPLPAVDVFGTPMLDQRRKRVHNAVQIFISALQKQNDLVITRSVEATNWLQCDACDKWRKVPANAGMDDLPETFVCEDNDWEPQYASCDVPQEQWEGVVTQLDTKIWTDEELKPGTKLDVFCDKSCVWSPATIIKQVDEKFRVHYHGWNKRYDEWIPKSEAGFKRIATFGTHVYE